MIITPSQFCYQILDITIQEAPRKVQNQSPESVKVAQDGWDLIAPQKKLSSKKVTKKGNDLLFSSFLFWLVYTNQLFSVSFFLA